MNSSSVAVARTDQDRSTEPWYAWLAVVLIALATFAIPLSPTLDSLIALSVIWTLCVPKWRQSLIYVWRQPAWWCLLAYLLWMLIRTIGGYPVGAVVKFTQLKHNLSWALPLFLLPPLFQRSYYRFCVYGAVMASGLVLIILMFLNLFLHHSHSAFADEVATLLGLISAQVQQSSVWLALCAYLFALVAYASHVHSALRISALVIVLLMGYCLLDLQDERVGLVVYALGQGFALYRCCGWRWLSVGSIVFILLLGAIIVIKPGAINGRIGSSWQHLQAYWHNTNNEQNRAVFSISQRLYYYRHSAILFNQHPWVGFGTGTFRGSSNQLVTTPTLGGYQGNVENNFLTMLLQLGLIGLVLFTAFLFYLWRLGRQLPPLEREIMLGVIFITVWASMSFAAFATNNIATLFAILIAACLGSVPTLKNGEA